MVIVTVCVILFFFKQKTAYEMRISDWSSDVCSSDLGAHGQCGRDLYRRQGSPLSGDRRLRCQRSGPVRSDPGRFQRRTAAVFAQMAIEPERGLQPAAGWREPNHGHDDLLTKQIAGR